METTEILQRFDEAVYSLLINEENILNRRLNERVLSNRLADYLRPLFEDFDVDTEYNGDIDKPNDRKALAIAKKRIEEINYQPNKSSEYKLSPDIIIHQRGTNEYNLVVIEVKKDISPDKDKEYDLIKLEHLTINYSENHYNYKLGIAIVLGTGSNTGWTTKTFFQNGQPKEQDKLE